MKKYLHKTPSTHATSMDIGKLYPIQCLDVLMGQTTWLDTSAVLRFQPLVAPALVKMDMHIVHFYVPYRLLWEQWNDFISGTQNLLIPKTKVNITLDGGFDIASMQMDWSGSLFDYLGFPVNWASSTSMNLNFNYFPFLAYYKIWNEHFRDENIQTELDIEAMAQKYQEGFTYSLSSSSSLTPLQNDFNQYFGLLRVNWGRDRFTKALLETQTDPAINLPVSSNGQAFTLQDDLKRPVQFQVSTNSGDNYPFVPNTHTISTYDSLEYQSGLTGVSMSDFKLASSVWNFIQNQNKYGRSVEAYFKKYGVRNMDVRLQQSEVIGGFAETIQISDIIATDSSDLGKQGGHAVGFAKRKAFKHYAPEAGLIMTMAYLRPKATYNGGIKRFYMKSDMMDFYQAEFANLGYQPIFEAEIGTQSANPSLPADEDSIPVFGYEPRYEEYRHEMSETSGELRPSEPLAHWTNPRIWTTAPNLNSNFLECNPSTQIWASPTTDKCIAFFNRKVSKKCFVPHSSDPKIKL